jgi:CheY-like chemotaxis protein
MRRPARSDGHPNRSLSQREPRQRPARILIVDDRDVVRETVIDILAIFDAEFREAADVDSALEHIAVWDPDVIILDIMLQDEADGLDVLRLARERHFLRGKTIVLTGRPAPEMKAIADSMDVLAYLTKPIDTDEVRETVKKALPEIRLKPVPMVAAEPVLVKVRERATKLRRTKDLRQRVLVLDDKQMWLDTIEQILGNDFRLTLTTSVGEAWRHARKTRFDLVVLDMKLLGGVSGLDVLDRMRKAIPDLRAIMLTEHPDYGSALESGKRGALDYVSKADVADLAKTAKKVLLRETPPRVLLSYESTDRPKVLRLYERLTSHGFLPWVDRKNIVGGKPWLPAIREAIKDVDFFVFCASQNSVLKEESVIHQELNWAIERQARMRDGRVFIIVARLEPCDVPPSLEGLQYVNLHERDGFKKLLAALVSKPPRKKK